MPNVFLKPREFYKRELSPIKGYVEQNAFYASKITGKPFNECLSVIKQNLNRKSFPNIKDPTVRFFYRGDNLDKEAIDCRLTQYIGMIVNDGRIVAPTMTTYDSVTVKVSSLVKFVDGNKVRRSIAKKAAFAAKTANNTALYNVKDNEQTNMKLFNNSLSGAFATEGSCLINPTAHSTLTSTTRLESSISNASNEKIISGNRHYFNTDIILNNIISIAYLSDKEKIREVINKYNLKYPTYQDTIDCIEKSAKKYLYIDDLTFKHIYELVSKLDDVDRAAFVYVSDLYHIKLHNPEFIKNFIFRLAEKITNKNYDDPIAIIKSTEESIVNLVHLVCMSEVRGFGKDYGKMPIESLNKIAATCENITNILIEYSDFIEAFFLTKNMPVSTANIRSMYRENVVLSDTDSTMFSVDQYVIDYFGKLVFNDEANAVAGVVMFMATQCIAHLLAIFSANINVEPTKLFDIAMKPEYAFPVFAQTSVAKHYFTCKTVQEGNVFSEPEMEIKGVHLKNSATPAVINKAAHKVMEEILFKVMRNEPISLIEHIKITADLERSIFNSVMQGETTYFKKSKIKGPNAYAEGPDKSPYARHVFWNNIFGFKYGMAEEPPYSVIKIPTILNNKMALATWINEIEDKELASKLSSWVVKNNKANLPTLYVSVRNVSSYGLPPEILKIVDIKRIILDLTTTHRMILGSLGYFPKPDLLLMDLGY